MADDAQDVWAYIQPQHTPYDAYWHQRNGSAPAIWGYSIPDGQGNNRAARLVIRDLSGRLADVERMLAEAVTILRRLDS